MRRPFDICCETLPLLPQHINFPNLTVIRFHLLLIFGWNQLTWPEISVSSVTFTCPIAMRCLPSVKPASITRELRRIWPYLDLETASTIATALVHSKLDYCNSLYLALSKTELSCLQLIQNALGHVVANTKRHEHITPSLQSRHWLKTRERITYKIVAVT